MFASASMRWHLKKIARAGVTLSALTAPRIHVLRGRPRVRVLTYHRFGHTSRDPFCVSPEHFNQQMGHLAARGLAISLDQFERFLAGKLPLPDGAVLVTIDDGFRCTYEHALPILQRWSVPAVAFITPSLIEQTSSGGGWRGQHQPASSYCSWDELRALEAAGVRIGSHAWTHRSLGRMDHTEVEDQVSRSRDTLERHLRQPVRAFAYPFGTRADFNALTKTLLKRSGYAFAFTSQHGAISAGADALELPRIKVEGGEARWIFRALVQGGLDNWRWIDRALWRLQAVDHGN